MHRLLLLPLLLLALAAPAAAEEAPTIAWQSPGTALLTAPVAGELRLVRGGVEQPGMVVVEEPGAIVLPPPGPRDAGWRPRPGDVWCYAGGGPCSAPLDGRRWRVWAPWVTR